VERRPLQGGAGSGEIGGGLSGGATGATTAGASGGRAGSAGAATSFPATGLLDDFNRSSGLGTQWFHPQTNNYIISGERLECTSCVFVHPSLWAEQFGPNQEVYATLAAFEGGTSEISLILLSQGGSCRDVEVVYAPDLESIRVDICRRPGVFTYLWTTERTLAIGDRLGGRVLPGNQIEVWVNEERIATVDASSWEFASGYIGVTGHNHETNPTTIAWDDFGGGEY
jgi:hypothetical protein